jgi:hypothetical protein
MVLAVLGTDGAVYAGELAAPDQQPDVQLRRIG